MAPTFVDLFCGIGGFRLGLEAAGFRCVYANDINERSVQVYEDNRRLDAMRNPEYTDYPVVTRDILKVEFDEIPDHDLLAAGFPCNAYASCGKRQKCKDPTYGKLPTHLVEIVKAKQPLVVFLENVMPFFLDDKGESYNKLKKSLDEADYNCTFKLYQAWDFELPQNRTRGFIVAVRNDVDSQPFEFPISPVLANLSDIDIRSVLLDPNSSLLKEVASHDPCNVGMSLRRNAGLDGYEWHDIINHPPCVSYPKGGTMLLGGVLTPRLKRIPHTTEIPPLTTRPVRLYHDLGHSPTITSSPGGRHWFLTRGGEDGHPVIRKLHPREVGRLQGFPEDFELHGTMTTAMKQLGQAVPPPMVEFVAKAIKERYSDAFSGRLTNAKDTKGNKRPATDPIDTRPPKLICIRVNPELAPSSVPRRRATSRLAQLKKPRRSPRLAVRADRPRADWSDAETASQKLPQLAADLPGLADSRDAGNDDSVMDCITVNVDGGVSEPDTNPFADVDSEELSASSEEVSDFESD